MKWLRVTSRTTVRTICALLTVALQVVILWKVY